MTEIRPYHPLFDPDGEVRVPAVGETIAGKYRVDGVVGAGGMGVVVAAEHIALGQSVAIKLLTVAGLDEARRAEACARFLREGQAAARLTSDHVVRIHDVGTLDDGTPFMVMELLRGDDLAAIIARKTPVPVDMAVEYVVQACDAVGEAHANGVVHRDLKPSNLFVTRRGDGHPVVKVLDFGISKTLASNDDPFEGNLTATRAVVGSPYYMSPEQVRDAKRVDARSDIWSLGMILYELLAGEPAFNGGTLPAICAAIAADTPEPVRSKRPEVSEELDAVVMRCLSKDPSRRFASVIRLVRALAPFLPPGTAVSTADYASRRLEASAKVGVGARLPSDHATFQSAPPSSGPRLSRAEPDLPFESARVRGEGDGSLASNTVGGTTDGVLSAATLSSGQHSVAIRDATLMSRTGTTLPAPEDAESGGMVGRVFPRATRSGARGRPVLIGVVATLLVAASIYFFSIPMTPQATPPEASPRLHESIGPAPPASEIWPIPVGAAVPPSPQPAATPNASAAPPVKVPEKLLSVAVKPHSAAAKPARPRTKPAASSPGAADIRLER